MGPLISDKRVIALLSVNFLIFAVLILLTIPTFNLLIIAPLTFNALWLILAVLVVDRHLKRQK